jgi:thiamine biosynthesis protein ThiI
MKTLLLIRHGEIGLKGKNRKYFENILTANIRTALAQVPGCRVRQTYSRYFVETNAEDTGEVITRLQKVFGIVSLSPVAVSGLTMDAIEKSALTELSRLARPGLRFKVQTKRANKQFPLPSPEISSRVGAYLLEKLPELVVDVHTPEQLLSVEIREKETYIYTEKIPGPGGLPVGVSGKGMLLISGGIDSPVAGWMAMKRGVTLEAVHFYSFPFTSERAKEKVIDLIRVLSSYGGKILLHVVHFTDIQKELRLKCPEKLTITLMRRMMFRIAERIAEKRGALALITGESLGQVASQTMHSIKVIEQVTIIPVLRPLIGFDKEEIVTLAKRIETFPISIRPYEDCCTVFLPEFPETRPRLEVTEEAEAVLDVKALVEESLVRIEKLEIM